MNIAVKSIVCVTSPRPKPGLYQGSWGGYVVRFEDADGEQYECRVEQGVRSLNAPCQVTVQNDGSVQVWGGAKPEPAGGAG